MTNVGISGQEQLPAGQDAATGRIPSVRIRLETAAFIVGGTKAVVSAPTR